MPEGDIAINPADGRRVQLTRTQDGSLQWVPIEGEQQPPLSPREQLQREQNRFTGSSVGGDTSFVNPESRNQFLQTLAGGTVANAISTPHAIGDVMAATAGGLEGLGRTGLNVLQGEPPNLGQEVGSAIERHERHLPAAALLAMPNPNAQDVLATVKTPIFAGREILAQLEADMGVDPGRALREGSRIAQSREQLAAQEFPDATAFGEAGADALTLIALGPGRRAMQLVAARNPGRAAAEVGTLQAKLQQALDSGDERTLLRGIAESIISVEDRKNLGARLRSAGRLFMRGLGRTGEATLDGALVAAMQDGDPLRTAAVTGGLQAAGSMLLTAKGQIAVNPLRAGAQIWLAHEVIKAIAPGPQDFFDSKDETVREIVAAYGAAYFSALTGGGRRIGGANADRILNAFSTGMRGTTASVVTQMMEAREAGLTHYEQVIGMVAQDPEAFDRETLVRLDRAANSDKPNALLDEIDSLMRSARFRRRYAEIVNPPATGVIQRNGQ